MLDGEAHDGLRVVVEHGRAQDTAADARDGDQRALLEHRREPVAQRAGRKGGEQDRRRVGHVGGPWRHPRLAQRQPPACRAPRRPVRAQPGRTQPRVERVEQHAIGRARPADVERQALREDAEQRAVVELRGQFEFECAR